MLAPAVQTALAELVDVFAGHQILTLEDGQGGANVIVEELPIGERFEQAVSWIGFQLGFQYPRAHVYPHWLRGDLARRDGQPLRAPLNGGASMPGFNRPAVMLSRASRGWNPATDSAARKLLRILQWLKEHA